MKEGEDDPIAPCFCASPLSLETLKGNGLAGRISQDGQWDCPRHSSTPRKHGICLLTFLKTH